MNQAMLTGVADCPHCKGTGHRHAKVTQRYPPSKAELYHIKLDMAECRLKDLQLCMFCKGAARIPAARAAAYRLVGHEQAALLYAYA